jgi:hypothetical protein
MIKTEKHKQSQDNICGTLCRLFMCCMSSNSQNINYELVRICLKYLFILEEITLKLILEDFAWNFRINTIKGRY